MTIPKELRDRYGLHPETEISFDETEAGLVLRPTKNRRGEIADRIARATGSATVPITTDEVMRLSRGDA